MQSRHYFRRIKVFRLFYIIPRLPKGRDIATWRPQPLERATGQAQFNEPMKFVTLNL